MNTRAAPGVTHSAYRESHRQHENHNRLRPTRAGTFWLAGVFALIAVAINYSNNLIFAMAFVMLSLWLQSAWLCRRNLRGLRWHPAPSIPVFAGERVVFSGTLGETTGISHFGLQFLVADTLSPPRNLVAGSDARLETGVPTVRRGSLQITTVALISSYPFGLWCCRIVLAPVDALVYPQARGDAALPGVAPVPAHRQYAADNFQGVRRYAPSDPTRRINWRVYGRSGQLVVNQFDGAQGGDALWLRWEQTQGEAEARLSQLAAWILAAQHDGLEYGLHLGRLPISPRRGTDHQAACLSALARFVAVDAPLNGSVTP